MSFRVQTNRRWTPLHASRPTVALLAVHYLRHAGQCLRGGAEKYIRNTVCLLLDAGADVHVNYSGDAIYDDLLEQYGDARLRIERTDWLDPALGRDRRFRPRLIASRRIWFTRHRPDVVLAIQQGNGGSFAASVAAAALAGCRVVASIRQMPAPPALPAPPESPPTTRRGLGLGAAVQRRRLIWRMRALMSFCQTVIFNSARVARMYADAYRLDARRFCVIHNIEPLAKAPRSRDRPDPSRFLREDRPRRIMLGAVGQVSEGKGADLTVAAFAHLAKRFPAADLVFFGEGAMAGLLRQRAVQAGLARRIIFAGRRDDPEAIYPNIDLLVLPSRRESSSNAVAEAMARGLPCIVSNAGGLPELVEHCVSGFVVPSGDVRRLTAAIARFLHRPRLLHEMGDAAYRRAARLFDPAANGRATLDAVFGAARSDNFGPHLTPLREHEDQLVPVR